ncbi:Translocon-associated protein subunit gamma [Apis mellifera carnica]|nr:Translocon-associated protein subunit gamma [Apis mellifera carnica]
MSGKSKAFTKEEELLLQDFSRNVSTKSSALFYGNAFIVSAIPIWLFWRIHLIDIYANLISFVLVTLASTYTLALAYKNTKFVLKHKIAVKREDAVTKEMSRKLSEDKKMSKKEKDERILWKKNEVADYEATTFSIFYNNALFLALVIADELPPEQIAVLRKAFDSFDREKSGSIPTDMVADILRLMGQPFNKKILDELIEEVDADKSGRLEFEEFVTLAAKFIVEEDAEALEKELREAFRLYDKEGNGYIPTTCLREILRELDDQLTDEELDIMIEEIDSDGSGTVDFDEFMEMMTGE